jgi:hypothetical protein
MRGLLLLMLAGLVAFGADDEWTKVRSLKMGAELRVYKKGSTQPAICRELFPLCLTFFERFRRPSLCGLPTPTAGH